jgi:hypothetical protein
MQLGGKAEQWMNEVMVAAGLGRRLNGRRRRNGKPNCADCFFHRQMLCALDVDEPCSTFRPNSAAGLAPLAQPPLLQRRADERLADAA